MKEEKQETKEPIEEKVGKEVEKFIKRILEQGIQPTNVDILYKVMNIHKDLANIDYWNKKKEEIDMRYKAYSEGSMGGYNGRGSYSGYMGGYGRGSEGDFKNGAYEKREYEEAMAEGGSYGRRGVPGSGRGSYSAGGSYGRRGVKGTGRGRYRGEEMMDEMMFHYGNYSEGGSYGGEAEKMEALNSLLESGYEYYKELVENAESPEEMKIMKHYFKKFSAL